MSSYPFLTAVTNKINIHGKTFKNGLVGGSGIKNTMIAFITKYKFVKRRNCSYKFFGKNVKQLYLEVLIVFFA